MNILISGTDKYDRYDYRVRSENGYFNKEHREQLKKQLEEARKDTSTKEYQYKVAEREKRDERNENFRKGKQKVENYAKDDLIKVQIVVSDYV